MAVTVSLNMVQSTPKSWFSNRAEPIVARSMEPEPADPAPAFPIDRHAVTLGGIVSTASDAWRRDLGTWVLATVLSLVIGTGIPGVLDLVLGVAGAFGTSGEPNTPTRALFEGLAIGLELLQMLIGGILTMGLWAMAMHGLHGRVTPIAALFSQIRKVLKFVLQQIAMWVPLGLVIATLAALVVWASVGTIDFDMPMDEAWVRAGPPLSWFALLSSPVLIYVVLGIWLAPIELTFDDHVGPVEAIFRSWRMARGKRWLILVTLVIAGIIGSASVLLCGVGILFGAPFATLLVAALYLALREGADLPTPDTTSTLGPR